MARFKWSALNHLQVGKYAEYFVMMEFTMHGFQVFSSEVDDRGIDFIAKRHGGGYLEVQVKSLRPPGYVFMQKDKFPISADRYVCLVLLTDGRAPDLYLIPSTAWKCPDELLVNRTYKGKKSPPEWGVNVSKKNLALLSRYQFDKTVLEIWPNPYKASPRQG